MHCSVIGTLYRRCVGDLLRGAAVRVITPRRAQYRLVYMYDVIIICTYLQDTTLGVAVM